MSDRLDYWLVLAVYPLETAVELMPPLTGRVRIVRSPDDPVGLVYVYATEAEARAQAGTSQVIRVAVVPKGASDG